MTKKFAAIRPDQLQSFTAQGWVYEGQTIQEQSVTTWRDENGREI